MRSAASHCGRRRRQRPGQRRRSASIVEAVEQLTDVLRVLAARGERLA
jgi:hypothetical protein